MVTTDRKTLLRCFIFTFVLTIVGILFVRVVDAEAICSGPPDYAGCTVAQAAEAEAGNPPRANKHYRADRWGQSHGDWKIGPKANRRIRNDYHQAVDRYIAKQRSRQAMFDSRGRVLPDDFSVQPKYMTWRGFKRASACVGEFGEEMPSYWCRARDHGGQYVTEDPPAATKAVLSCGGYVLAGIVAGGVSERILALAIGPQKLLAWGAGGWAGCVTIKIVDAVKGLF